MPKITIEIEAATDKNGEIIYPGDILLGMDRGGCFSPEEKIYFLKLWEMPNTAFDGFGIEYNPDGIPSRFYYASPKNSLLIPKNVFPEDFYYAFYHGLQKIETPLLEGTVEELINSSDWKERWEGMKSCNIKMICINHHTVRSYIDSDTCLICGKQVIEKYKD